MYINLFIIKASCIYLVKYTAGERDKDVRLINEYELILSEI